MDGRRHARRANTDTRKPTTEPVKLPSLQKPGPTGSHRIQKSRSEPTLSRNEANQRTVSHTRKEDKHTRKEDKDLQMAAPRSESQMIPHKAKRRILEVLTSPSIKSKAMQIYSSHLTNKHKGGELGFDDLRNVLRTLNEQMGIPLHSTPVAEKLFKRFDINASGTLSADEFYELFVSALRRCAFDNSSLFSRNIFVTKQSGKVWDTYDQVKKLGAGSFGAAYLTKHKRTGDERVVKSVEKSQVKLPVEDIEREIMVMLQIDHPNVVRLYEWYEGSSSIYLVIDALKGGTLRSVLLNNYHMQGRGVKEAWVQCVARQCLEAMAYCHSLRLIHKDLKDENIMMLKKDKNYDEPFVVIIDLGVAEMFPLQDPHGKMVGGTPVTMAPEVWTGNFGPKCDVWSLGCVFFEMLSGQLPFMANSIDPKDWHALHRRGPNWSSVKTSEHGRDLCKTMLTFSDVDRPSMAQCLQHKWFSESSGKLSQVVSPGQFEVLQSFSQMTELKRSLLQEIAGRLPMQHAERIVKVFKFFDGNKDGTLNKEELKGAFNQMGLKDTGIVERTYRALDMDGDGSLAFNEFAAGVLLMFKDLLEDRFRALFRRYDKDSDGTMHKNDVEAFLQNASKIVTKDTREHPSEVVKRMFEDGKKQKITYEELKKLILPTAMV